MIALEPLLYMMATTVLAELGIKQTQQMLDHAGKADEAGRAVAPSATQPCPNKPGDDDPCKHLRKGSGPGKYRGGAHGETKGPTGDTLDSHHMPSRQSNKLGGGPNDDDGPAIQMEREDHKQTMTYGRSKKAARFAAKQAKLLKENSLLDAVDNEIEDVKRVALEAGDPHRYDQAIKEMRAYADCLQNQIDKMGGGPP
jgi:hypothetical protein